MKNLFLLIGLLFLVVACSPEDSGCDCEATYSYEFYLSSTADSEAFEGHPRAENGNFLEVLKEPVDCGTTVENIELIEVFGLQTDMATRILADTEKVVINCD